jgi:hypothetical protein
MVVDERRWYSYGLICHLRHAVRPAPSVRSRSNAERGGFGAVWRACMSNARSVRRKESGGRHRE